MIDWVTVKLPYSHNIPAGSCVLVNPTGEIESEFPRRLIARASSDTTVGLVVRDGHLYVDGNANRWLTGQNLTGPDQLHDLVPGWLESVCETVGIPAPTSRVSSWRLRRLDIARTYQFASDDYVSALLRHLALAATMSNRGRPSLVAGSTVYFGQRSRRWAIKCYNKTEELRRGNREGVPSGLLRVELVLRGLELDRLGRTYEEWTEDAVVTTFDDYVSRMTISGGVITGVNLPPRLYGLYELWRRGVDLAATVPRASWYRYRRELLAHGVDIASIPSKIIEPTDVVTSWVVPPVREWTEYTPQRVLN